MPDGPAVGSVTSSIRSDFVQAMIMGTPEELCVKVPGPRGRRVLLRVDVVGRFSNVGSE